MNDYKPLISTETLDYVMLAFLVLCIASVCL